MIGKDIALIFHIGLPKTGTTFLQQKFFPSLDINFIDGSNPRNSSMNLSFSDYKTLGNVVRNMRNGRRQKKILNNYLSLDKINLVSYEGLFGNTYTKEPDHIRNINLLYDDFPNAKIILGVRNYDKIIKSLYNQYLKHGGTHEIDYFINKYILPEKFCLNEYETILYDKFKEENIYIYNYDTMLKDFKLFKKQICCFIDVPISPIQNDKKVNVSFKDQEIKALKLMNNLFKTRFNPKGIMPWPSKYMLPSRFLIKILFHNRFMNNKVN